MNGFVHTISWTGEPKIISSSQYFRFLPRIIFSKSLQLANAHCWIVFTESGSMISFATHPWKANSPISTIPSSTTTISSFLPRYFVRTSSLLLLYSVSKLLFCSYFFLSLYSYILKFAESSSFTFFIVCNRYALEIGIFFLLISSKISFTLFGGIGIRFRFTS